MNLLFENLKVSSSTTLRDQPLDRYILHVFSLNSFFSITSHLYMVDGHVQNVCSRSVL